MDILFLLPNAPTSGDGSLRLPLAPERAFEAMDQPPTYSCSYVGMMGKLTLPPRYEYSPQISSLASQARPGEYCWVATGFELFGTLALYALSLTRCFEGLFSFWFNVAIAIPTEQRCPDIETRPPTSNAGSARLVQGLPKIE